MTVRTLGLLCAGAASHIALAGAQSRAASADALLAVPDMYRVELENEFVRVVRVRAPAAPSIPIRRPARSSSLTSVWGALLCATPLAL